MFRDCSADFSGSCILYAAKEGGILYSICDSLIRLLEKIHIIRHGDRLRIKLKHTMKEYQECSNSITGQTGLLIEIFFWNIMQRVSQLLVSFMIFMAVGEGVNKAVDVSVIQCFGDGLQLCADTRCYGRG